MSVDSPQPPCYFHRHERLRKESKKLSPEEHLVPGEELLHAEKSATEATWEEEILRRVGEIKSGKVKMIPMGEVMGKLRRK